MTTILVKYRTRGEQSGWEAVTDSPVPTTLTIGLRPTWQAVVDLVEAMQARGEVNAEAPIRVVPPLAEALGIETAP